MNVVVGGLMIHPLDQKPEFKTIDRMFQALIYLLMFYIQNIGFHRHLSLPQRQLIRSQGKQLAPEVYITVSCICESHNFQNMVSSKVHF